MRRSHGPTTSRQSEQRSAPAQHVDDQPKDEQTAGDTERRGNPMCERRRHGREPGSESRCGSQSKRQTIPRLTNYLLEGGCVEVDREFLSRRAPIKRSNVSIKRKARTFSFCDS